ncbi:DUF3098 domain-containing protein [Belliella aquatica]|uniref:DUF3098 domain-containing protein n=1 Tax=Belliella aquatica TaxID=1323734 RepID=A0ABQ1MFR1_9BACT|nr:DUF3098 domain-containing protein [Belliella aquatica]MCH7405078.1 DUF3098 domain-containing protein [Belliella aquatica]GGC39948.1 hypothetical protein GCM10010993_18390 [Belliella aquatica]
MSNQSFPFTKKNYQLMLIGIAIIVIGFTIIGLDPETHGFGFMGLTLGPIVTLAGFIFEFYAIFHKSESK